MTRPATRRAAFDVRTALDLLPWLLVVLLTALNLLYIGRLGPNDDAYITYRVARNLANGLGPVFNPGERVLSVTTPGYMLLLAALSPFSQDYVALGLALNGLALLATGALLIDLSRQPRRPELNWLAALVAVAVGLTFPLLSEAIGMETPLYLAALLAAFAAYQRAIAAPASDQRWLLTAAAAAAAAFLLRPDGLLAGLTLASHWLITRRRLPWPALGLGLLLSLPWVLFAWAYYGSPLPNTLAAKLTQGLDAAAPTWGPQLRVVAQGWAAAQPITALAALLGLLIALLERPGLRLLLLAWAGLYIGLHALLDVRGYFWYYAPLAPLAGLLAGDGAVWLLHTVDRQLHQPRFSSHRNLILSAAAALLLATLLFPAALQASKLARRPELRQRELAYQRTGQALAELCAASSGPANQPVGLAEIGLIGYLSDCRVVDFAGLVQPDLAHLQASAADKMIWAIKRYAPPLVVLSGGETFPHTVADERWFRQRYEPLDIQIERGYRSVIYRRGLGPAEQRDLGQAAAPSAGATAFPSQGLASGGAPLTTTLVFAPPQASATITLHAYLPPDSRLAVTANGQAPTELQGQGAAWLDYPLPVKPAPDGAAALALSVAAGQQPAAVAWIESAALPAVHYFAPLEDASQRPRPTVRLDPGQTVAVELAPAAAGPAALELVWRDWPGVQLTVLVDGQPVGRLGGDDGWRAEQLPLPPRPSAPGNGALQITVRNQGEHYARLAHVALVPPFERGLATEQ